MTPKHARLYDGDTFEHEGHTFRVNAERDDFMSAPWEEHDGHGPVSDWKPSYEVFEGERILCSDRHSVRCYGWAEALEIAKREQWGSAGDEGLDPDAKAARAVEHDFEYLRGWCNDDWCWLYIVVTLLDEDGEGTQYRASLGGVSDPDGTYLADVARDLADEVLSDPELVAANYYDMEASS